MFGKRTNSTDSFVMAMGRKAGNIKRASPAAAGAGKKSTAMAGKSATKSVTPAKAGAGKKANPAVKVAAPKVQMHSGNGMSGALSIQGGKGFGPAEVKPWSLGKANTFKTSGKTK